MLHHFLLLLPINGFKFNPKSKLLTTLKMLVKITAGKQTVKPEPGADLESIYEGCYSYTHTFIYTYIKSMLVFYFTTSS